MLTTGIVRGIAYVRHKAALSRRGFAYRKPWSLERWRENWDAKAAIANPIEINGYCREGSPIDEARYRTTVLEPTIELLELQPHHHVLDVGCGTGMLLTEIERRVARAVGTDFSEALLSRYQGRSETYVCAAHELPFNAEQFDRIAMCAVAQYFPDVGYFRDVFVKLIALLKPKGILLVGDLPLLPKPARDPYLWYEPRDLISMLDELALPFEIRSQSALKRTINRRYDVLVYKAD